MVPRPGEPYRIHHERQKDRHSVTGKNPDEKWPATVVELDPPDPEDDRLGRPGQEDRHGGMLGVADRYDHPHGVDRPPGKPVAQRAHGAEDQDPGSHDCIPFRLHHRYILDLINQGIVDPWRITRECIIAEVESSVGVAQMKRVENVRTHPDNKGQHDRA